MRGTDPLKSTRVYPNLFSKVVDIYLQYEYSLNVVKSINKLYFQFSFTSIIYTYVILLIQYLSFKFEFTYR